MRRYRAYFGTLRSTIYTERRITKSNEMWFDYHQTGGKASLLTFTKQEDAEQMYDALSNQRHPSFARVLPIFTVGGVKGVFFLALRQLGQSLEDILADDCHQIKFYENRRVTPFYQKLLMDLLLVVRHTMNTHIECTLSLSEIYVFDERTPITPQITITHFKWRGCEGSNSDYKKVASIVRSINKKAINEDLPMEIIQLIECLDAPTHISLAEMSSFPLFWSPEQRRLFPRQLCDFCAATKDNIDGIESMVDWREVVQNRGDALNELKQYVDRKNVISVPYMETENPMSEGWKNLSLQKKKQANECLQLIRKGLAHFQEIKRVLPSWSVNSEEDLAILFESAFKDYILRLYQNAMQWKAVREKSLLPRNNLLNDLYKPE